jgi:hypothetical protein
MPVPKPKKGEKEKDFISRCIPVLMDEGREQKQSIAICYSTWRKEKGIPEPIKEWTEII